MSHRRLRRSHLSGASGSGGRTANQPRLLALPGAAELQSAAARSGRKSEAAKKRPLSSRNLGPTSTTQQQTTTELTPSNFAENSRGGNMAKIALLLAATAVVLAAASSAAGSVDRKEVSRKEGQIKWEGRQTCEVKKSWQTVSPQISHLQKAQTQTAKPCEERTGVGVVHEKLVINNE